MATPLTETATFDAQVIVPEDGLDDESAASLVPPFQSLADRSQWLKGMWTKLLSTFDLNDSDTTWRIYAHRALKLVTLNPGDGTGTLDLKGVYLMMNQNIIGPIFSGNQYGRANLKPLNVATTGTIDPFAYDTYRNVGATGSISLSLPVSSPTAVEGDHFMVLNVQTTSGRTVSVFADAGEGGALTTIPIAVDGATPSWAEFMWDGAQWFTLRRFVG